MTPRRSTRTEAADPPVAAAGVRHIGGVSGLQRSVTPERAARAREERRLFEHYRRSGEETARTAIVARFLPLARSLARRYQGGGEPLDDLVQVASLGLLKAIDRFDPEHGTAFSSFAVPTILGEIKRHFRDKAWSIRVPRDLQELALRVERVSAELGDPGAGPADLHEIARRVGTTPERVLEAREAARAYRPMSLDAGAPDAEDADDGLAGLIGAEDRGYARAEDAATVARLLRVLTERERTILHLRFAEDLTQSEIGARVGVSQMHVSRIIRRALAALSAAGSADREHHPRVAA